MENASADASDRKCVVNLICCYEDRDHLVCQRYYLNEVIPLCINSVYLIYHIFPSAQHTSLSLSLHVST